MSQYSFNRIKLYCRLYKTGNRICVKNQLPTYEKRERERERMISTMGLIIKFLLEEIVEEDGRTV